MTDNLEKELELYKNGNIDELIELMDEDQNQQRTTRQPPNQTKKSSDNNKTFPTMHQTRLGPVRQVMPSSGNSNNNNVRRGYPTQVPRLNPNAFAPRNAMGHKPKPQNSVPTYLQNSGIREESSNIVQNKGGIGDEEDRQDLESNYSTISNASKLSRVSNVSNSSSMSKMSKTSNFSKVSQTNARKVSNALETPVLSQEKLSEKPQEVMDEKDETETIVNGRIRRARPDLSAPPKAKPVKPVAGIDENWFLQKTEEGINLLDYTGKLPLSVPNEDVFKLNSVRSAARSVLRMKNRERAGIIQNQELNQNVQETAQTLNEERETPNLGSTNDSDIQGQIGGVDSQFIESQEVSEVPLIEETLLEVPPTKEVDVPAMLSSGTELLTKVKTLLQSNIPIPMNGLEGLDEEVDPNKPVVPEEKILELHQVQDKWLELDNEIKGIRSLIKDLQAKQRELSEYLKSEMLKYQIPHLKSLQGDKIILKSQNRKGTYKKDYIFTKLQEVLQDPEMAANLSEHLENGRPISESINLSRTKK